jgi:hypothetical protein
MQILNSFLFICFLYLCNSFTLINKKYSHNMYKLNMGCDYYVDKDLHIYDHHDIVFSYIMSIVLLLLTLPVTLHTTCHH